MTNSDFTLTNLQLIFTDLKTFFNTPVFHLDLVGVVITSFPKTSSDSYFLFTANPTPNLIIANLRFNCPYVRMMNFTLLPSACLTSSIFLSYVSFPLCSSSSYFHILTWAPYISQRFYQNLHFILFLLSLIPSGYLQISSCKFLTLRTCYNNLHS